jgi:hypothetical protein
MIAADIRSVDLRTQPFVCDSLTAARMTGRNIRAARINLLTGPRSRTG